MNTDQNMMKNHLKPWRAVRHPLSMITRHGWTIGRGCFISPRGTVFVFRRTPGGYLARRRFDFQLIEE